MSKSDANTDLWQEKVKDVAAAVSDLQKATTPAEREQAMERVFAAQRAARDVFNQLRGAQAGDRATLPTTPR
jgi:hypothetical protein